MGLLAVGFSTQMNPTRATAARRSGGAALLSVKGPTDWDSSLRARPLILEGDRHGFWDVLSLSFSFPESLPLLAGLLWINRWQLLVRTFDTAGPTRRTQRKKVKSYLRIPLKQWQLNVKRKFAVSPSTKTLWQFLSKARRSHAARSAAST